jgi:DNA-binding transcriptional LysR family regulator
MAQPPLSQQIRDLERELGVELFKRSSRKVELTSHGRILLKEAEALLEQAARTEAAVKASKRGEFGFVSLGYVTSALYSVFSPVLREFHSRYPNVEIHCKEMSPQMQIEALNKGAIDIGFLRTPVFDPNIVAHPLLQEWLVLAIPADHPKAESPSVSLRDFADDPFVMFTREQGPGIYDQIIATCREAGFSPRLSQEGAEMLSLLALVAGGMGVSLVPSSLQTVRQPGLVFKTLSEKTAIIELALALRAGEPSPVEQAFIDVGLSVARQKYPYGLDKPCWYQAKPCQKEK